MREKYEKIKTLDTPDSAWGCCRANAVGRRIDRKPLDAEERIFHTGRGIVVFHTATDSTPLVMAWLIMAMDRWMDASGSRVPTVHGSRCLVVAPCLANSRWRCKLTS